MGQQRWVLLAKENDIIRIHTDFDYCRHFGDLLYCGTVFTHTYTIVVALVTVWLI